MSKLIANNVSGADDQQERPQKEWLDKIPQQLGYYLAGFVDGEGRTRKYSASDVFKTLSEESSETIRLAPTESEMI